MSNGHGPDKPGEGTATEHPTRTPDLTRSPNPLEVPSETPGSGSVEPPPTEMEEPELGGPSVNVAQIDPALLLPPSAERGSPEQLLAEVTSPLVRRGKGGSQSIKQFATLQRIQSAAAAVTALATGREGGALGRGGVDLLRQSTAFVACLACRSDLARFWKFRVTCATFNLADDQQCSSSDRIRLVLGDDIARKADALETALLKWSTLRAKSPTLDDLVEHAETVSTAIQDMNTELAASMGDGIEGKSKQLAVLQEFAARIGTEFAREVGELLARQDGEPLAGRALLISPRGDAVVYSLRSATARYVGATTGVTQFPETVQRVLARAAGLSDAVRRNAASTAKGFADALIAYNKLKQAKTAGDALAPALRTLKETGNAITDALIAARQSKSTPDATLETISSLGLVVSAEIERVMTAEQAEGKRLFGELALKVRRQAAPDQVIVAEKASTVSDYWTDQFKAAFAAVATSDAGDAARLTQRMTPTDELAEALKDFFARGADPRSDADGYLTSAWRVTNTLARFRSAVLSVLGGGPQASPFIVALDKVALTVAYTAKGVSTTFRV